MHIWFCCFISVTFDLVSTGAMNADAPCLPPPSYQQQRAPDIVHPSLPEPDKGHSNPLYDRLSDAQTHTSDDATQPERPMQSTNPFLRSYSEPLEPSSSGQWPNEDTLASAFGQSQSQQLNPFPLHHFDESNYTNSASFYHNSPDLFETFSSCANDPPPPPPPPHAPLTNRTQGSHNSSISKDLVAGQGSFALYENLHSMTSASQGSFSRLTDHFTSHVYSHFFISHHEYSLGTVSKSETRRRKS